MKGPGPLSVSLRTGRLGLTMSSGMMPGAANRRQKICEEDEFIANVTGSSTSSAFTISNTINVNPGLIASFPWLAGEASRYNEYEFEYLEYYYKRTVSEFNSGGQTGKVLLFFDPDATDVAPTTKQQIEDSVYHNDGMPSDPLIRLPIDCQRLNKNIAKYVRTGANPANTDLKTYDVGILYAAADSTSTSSNIGELRVRYRIKFTVPILTPSSVVGGVMHFSSTSPTTSNNFNNAVLQSGYTPTLGGISVSTNTITFPSNVPGNYLIQLSVAGSTSASALALASTTTTALNLITQVGTRNAVNYVFSAANTSNGSAMFTYCCTVPETGANIVLTPSTLVGGNAMDLFIVSLPSTVLTVDETEQLEIDELKSKVSELSRNLEYLMKRTLFPPLISIPHEDGDAVLDSPDECKESDLEKSVHIPASAAQKLLRLVNGK